MRHRKYEYKPINAKRRYVYPLLAVLLVALAGLVAVIIWARSGPAAENQTNETVSRPVVQPQRPFESIAGKYMFSGTVVLDRTVTSDARTASGYDYKQPFSGMDTFGKFDASIADLECPVTNNPVPPEQQIEVDNPKFNCSPDWLPELKKYFPIVNLSSNHTYDRGAEGFIQTVKNLKDAGFQVVGNYDPHTNKDNCTVVMLPVRLEKDSAKKTKGKLPVAFCSFNYKIIFSTPQPGELDYINKYQKVMPVFGMLNAGREYLAQAEPQKIDISHQMIDEGADFVIGNGAHWAQNTEAYKGKLITYSLGNFIFDQEDANSRQAANIILKVSAKYSDNLDKWLKLGKKCQPDPASCFKMAEQQGLQKPDLKYSFDMIASDGGYHAVVHKADASVQKAISDRLDWPTTLKGLTY